MQKKEALEKISRYLDYLAHRAQLSHQPLHVKQASCNNLIKLSKLLHSTGDLFASLKQVLPKSTEAQRAKLAQQLSRGAARFAKQANQPPGMGPAPRAGQWRSFLPQVPVAPPLAPAPAAPAAPAKPPVPAAAAKPPASAGRSFAQGAAGALGGFLGGASGLTNVSRGVQALMGSGR